MSISHSRGPVEPCGRITMRCTRCDHLAVPQAVGIDPRGRVVFGWCLACLRETRCRLVELPRSGPGEIHFSSAPAEKPRRGLSEARGSSTAADQPQWILGLLAFLMITWGLLLLAAGIFSIPRTSSSSPLGNGTGSLLGFGGGTTALVGLSLLILSSRRRRFSGAFPLPLLNWLGFLAALGMLAYGVFDYQPRRNLPLVLGAGIALAVSVTARVLERTHRRKERPTLAAGH